MPTLELFWGNPNGQFCTNWAESPDEILNNFVWRATLISCPSCLLMILKFPLLFQSNKSI
jgi:hypothetical protein